MQPLTTEAATPAPGHPTASAAPAASGLSKRASRLLTASLALSAALFVALTLGSSLVGLTSFYGGGELVNHNPWLTYGQEPIAVTNNTIGDTIDSIIPGRAQIVDRAYSGDWPGWNSLQGAGADLASVPSYGLLNPAALSWWLLPHALAPAWEKLAVLVLSTVGTYLFLRRLTVVRHAAWLGGMVYAASGFMIAWTNWPQADLAAMLPWLLWSTERALQLRTWRAQIPVALTVAFLLLAGFPAVTGQGLYLAAGYVLLRMLTRVVPDGRRLRTALADAGRLLAGLVVGFLLAGVQLVVFAYSLLDVDTEYRADWFGMLLPLRMSLTSLFPNVWGTRHGEPFFTTTNPIEANAYLGVAGMVLVVAALLLRPGRHIPRGARSYFATVVVLGVLLIYVQGPLLQWVGALPVFSGNPIGRLTSVVLLASAVLAGIGADAIVRGGARASGRRIVLLAGLATVTILVAGLGYWAYRQTADLLDPGTQKQILGLALVGTVATAAVVWLVAQRPGRWGAALAVVPVVVAVQGITAATPMWAQVDRSAFYPSTPVHEFLLENQGHDRIAVTGGTMIPGPTAYYGLRTSPGHVFSTPAFQDLQRAVCEPCLLTGTVWVLPATTELDVWRSPALDRMGARYLTSDPDQVIPGREEQLVTGDEPLPVPAAEGPALSSEIPGGPLRGVLLDFRSGPAVESRGFLVAEVRDEQGEVLTSTRRLIQYPRPARQLYVPIDGEGLAEGGPLTLSLSWDGPGEAPVLSADADGRPVLTLIRPAEDGLRLVHGQGALIWERLDALPRVRWASSAEVVPSSEDRAARVADADLPPDTVVLDEQGPDVDGGPASVEVLEDSGDRVRVRVDADGAGWLVLADSVQTDWTASLDGEPADIVAADHAFGAVHVPEGRHEVTFGYEPRGETEGYVASAVGLVALGLMAVLPAVRRRRDDAATAGDAAGR